jgi:nucleoside-diphosphate-sugar epimerase
MRVFLAGASGVIGIRLVPLLMGAGHEVAGLTRSPDKAAQIDAFEAQPVVGDVFDAAALLDAVSAFAPDLVLHQLTDLPDNVEQIPDYAERNNRIRTEGTRNLLTAATATGADRFLAQSIAWVPPGSTQAVAEHERQVLDAGGVVVRYGQLYGPGTYYPDEPPPPPRIHVDDAAQRTMALLDAPSGIVTITKEDDEVSGLTP